MELNDKLIQSCINQEVAAPCVSLYIPTHPKSTSQRMNEDRIRFKNALQQLDAQQAFTSELADSQAELYKLVDDSDFWQHQSRSLGVLADTSGLTTVYLPHELTPVAHSGDNCAISPLLIMQSLNQSYYLLDVDFDGSRLYTGNQSELEAVDNVDLPGAIEDVIEIEQRRTMSGERGGRGGVGVTHYGRSEAEDQQASDVSRYLQLLAEPLNNFLKDKSEPLFIAGSPKVIVELRSMLDYGHIEEAEIAANYDQNRLADLHASSLAAMTDLAQSKKTQVLERYASLDYDMRADGMTAVEAAAEQGKVDTLLLPIVRVTADGITSDGEQHPLIELPEDFASFEAIVRKVAEQSGTIVPVEQDDFADDPSMKAILRY